MENYLSITYVKRRLLCCPSNQNGLCFRMVPGCWAKILRVKITVLLCVSITHSSCTKTWTGPDQLRTRHRLRWSVLVSHYLLSLFWANESTFYFHVQNNLKVFVDWSHCDILVSEQGLDQMKVKGRDKVDNTHQTAGSGVVIGWLRSLKTHPGWTNTELQEPHGTASSVTIVFIRSQSRPSRPSVLTHPSLWMHRFMISSSCFYLIFPEIKNQAEDSSSLTENLSETAAKTKTRVKRENKWKFNVAESGLVLLHPLMRVIGPGSSWSQHVCWPASVTLNQHEIENSSFHTAVQEVKGQSLSKFQPSDNGQLHQFGSI